MGPQSNSGMSNIELGFAREDAVRQKKFADISKMNSSVFNTKLRSEGVGERILGGGAQESRASKTQAYQKISYVDLTNGAKKKTPRELAKSINAPSEMKMSSLVNANNKTHIGIRGPGQSSGREKIWKSVNLNSTNPGNTSDRGLQGLTLISNPKKTRIFEKDQPIRKTLDAKSLMSLTQENADSPRRSLGVG